MLSGAGDLPGQETLVASWQALAGPVARREVDPIHGGGGGVPVVVAVEQRDPAALAHSERHLAEDRRPGGVPRSAAEAIHGSVVAQ